MISDPDEQTTRRERSTSYLVRHGVPFIEHLPNIETEDETLHWTPLEVGLRIICLALVSMKGAGAADHDFVINGVRHYNVLNELSLDERKFIHDPHPTEHDMLQFSWRAEAAHVLIWAVGLVESLTYPSEPCDWMKFWEEMVDDDREALLSELDLRPQSEIMDEADLIYRLHWAARDASLVGQTPPASLSESVVMERHHALNWLIAPLDDP